MSDEDADELRIRAVETRTGLAQTHRIRRTLFESPEYTTFRKVHAALVELAGTPPFTVKLADKSDEALSFEALRETVIDVVRRQRGIGAQPLQGAGRDERRAAARDDHGPREPHARAGHDGGRRDRRPHLLDADGRRGRVPAQFIEDNALAATVDV